MMARLPPRLRTISEAEYPVPDEPFRAGQLVVIEPTAVARDGRACLQTDELVLITDAGGERRHALPRRLRAGVVTV